VTRTVYVPGATNMVPDSVQVQVVWPPLGVQPLGVRLSPAGSPPCSGPPFADQAVVAVAGAMSAVTSVAEIATGMIGLTYGTACAGRLFVTTKSAGAAVSGRGTSSPWARRIRVRAMAKVLLMGSPLLVGATAGSSRENNDLRR